jgi:hypothetical protein
VSFPDVNLDENEAGRLSVFSEVTKNALKAYLAAKRLNDEIADGDDAFDPLADILISLSELLIDVVYNHLQVYLGDEDEDVITGKDPLDLIKEKYVYGTPEEQHAAAERYSFPIEVAAEFYIAWAKQETERFHKEYSP